MRVLEVCVDSYESALIAAKSGADRLELCHDLSVGGLTPTAGLVSVVKKAVSIPVYVLIRPRAGNFQYVTHEVEQMLADIKVIKQIGADGFVFGALSRQNEVDVNICQQLLSESSNFPATFHRAFDKMSNKEKALDEIIKLGFTRILTSGGLEAAIDGIETLKNLVNQACDRIIIMPGGNINEDNILHVLQTTKAREFHSSGRTIDLNSPTKKSNICSKEVIQNMRKVLDNRMF